MGICVARLFHRSGHRAGIAGLCSQDKNGADTRSGHEFQDQSQWREKSRQIAKAEELGEAA